MQWAVMFDVSDLQSQGYLLAGLFIVDMARVFISLVYAGEEEKEL